MYWKVSIKIESETDKGKVKLIKEEYLVKGISPTDVETKIHKHFVGMDFEVVSVTQTKILEVFED